MIRFGSVCSGIEAASVAWEPLGWKAAWLSEIEPFPSAVLAHHYHDVPNLGDMRTLSKRIRSGEIEAPDVLCGGTPCQAFSVAGLRSSLNDERGNLSLEFIEVLNAIDDVRGRADLTPAVAIWENVPGVFSTKDNAFGCFLAGLSGEDVELLPSGGRWTDAGCVFGPRRAVAWRCLDSQYFGLAQRRKRVFVVASARDGFSPAEVLFEWDRVRRDTAPSRSTAQDVAGTLAASIGRSRKSGTPPEFCVGVEIGTSGARFSELNPTLDSRAKDGPIRNQIAGAVLSAPIAFHPTQDQITSTDGSVNALGCGSSSGGQANDAVAFDTRNGLAPHGSMAGDVISKTLLAKNSFVGSAAVNHFLPDLAQCLTAGTGQRYDPETETILPVNVDVNLQVRRLTPVECERLQGFPDGYTMIFWRGKNAADCPDGPRYKAIGNSWAVPVARWVGQRVNDSINQEDEVCTIQTKSQP